MLDVGSGNGVGERFIERLLRALSNTQNIHGQNDSFRSTLGGSNDPKESSLASSEARDAKDAVQASRGELLTLHALFPTLLLPALDLLDRQCVLQLIPSHLAQSARPGADSANEHGRDTGLADLDESNIITEAVRTAEDGSREDRMQRLYFVASNASSGRKSGPIASSPSGRYQKMTASASESSGSRGDRQGHAFSGQDAPLNYHEVHISAWSCSCAAFAFAAYHRPLPSESRGTPAWKKENMNHDNLNLIPPRTLNMDPLTHLNDPIRWGGQILKYNEEDEEAPVCKHLLACILAERWPRAQRLVERRMVSIEEFAGWCAGWV